MATNPEANVGLHRPPFFRNFPIICASFWYHHRGIQLLTFAYGNDSNKVIIYRTGRLRESDVQAHPSRRRENGNLRGRWLLVWEYKICYTFIIFIRHRTEENNHRHLSHCFKNSLFGDRGPNNIILNMHRVFFEAELRKFGEVHSHPPHPHWLRHWHDVVAARAHSQMREIWRIPSNYL